MATERYLLIRKNLKLVDDLIIDQNVKNDNKLWKVQPLIESVRNGCLRNPRPSKVSADEQMIPFWGRTAARQYIRGKPNPCGLKNLVVTDVDGLPLDFFIYQGKGDSITSDPSCTRLNIGGKIIMQLTKTLNEGTVVYMDRYFTSIHLLDLLHSERKMQATGTLQNSQVPEDANLQSDKQLSSVRGS